MLAGLHGDLLQLRGCLHIPYVDHVPTRSQESVVVRLRAQVHPLTAVQLLWMRLQSGLAYRAIVIPQRPDARLSVSTACKSSTVHECLEGLWRFIVASDMYQLSWKRCDILSNLR